MNVYLASREFPYEGDRHVGAFTTLPKAKRACQTDRDKFMDPRKLAWTRVDGHHVWRSDSVDYDYYTVQRMTVDKVED